MSRRPSNKTIATVVGLFVLFFILSFPYRNLRGFIFGKVYQSTGIRIDAEDLSPVFLGWPGLRLYNASIFLPSSGGGASFGTSEAAGGLEISAKKITTRVGIGGLFPPAPRLSLYAQELSKGGNLYFKGTQGKRFLDGAFETESVSLLPFTTFSPEPIDGSLSAEGSFHYDMAELSRSTGQATLDLKKLRIPGMNYQGIILPEIIWDTVSAKLEAKNGNLDIIECQFGTPTSGLSGNLSGYVRLGRDLFTSHIDVVLRVRMTDAYRNDPQSATLVSFLKTFESSKKPGEYALKWAATPAEMSTNVMAALPSKAE
jgi:type II secretion system protein N